MSISDFVRHHYRHFNAATLVEAAVESTVGFFRIGDGIVGERPICVVAMFHQDLWRPCPYWAYFCQISDSTTSHGSYAGAIPTEKITWGKLDLDTPKFVIESDARHRGAVDLRPGPRMVGE